jgi:hypothetical protein
MFGLCLTSSDARMSSNKNATKAHAMPPKRAKHTSKTIVPAAAPPSHADHALQLPLFPQDLRPVHDKITSCSNNANIALSFVRKLYWLPFHGAFHPVSILLRDLLPVLEDAILWQDPNPRMQIGTIAGILMRYFTDRLMEQCKPVPCPGSSMEYVKPATKEEVINAYIHIMSVIERDAKTMPTPSDWSYNDVSIDTAIECLGLNKEEELAAFRAAQRWHTIATAELANARHTIANEIGGIWSAEALQAYVNANVPVAAAAAGPTLRVNRAATGTRPKPQWLINQEFRKEYAQMCSKPRLTLVLLRQPTKDPKEKIHDLELDDGSKFAASHIELERWIEDARARAYDYDVALHPDCQV